MSQYNSPASIQAIFAGIFKRLSALERTKVTHGSGPPPTGFTEPYVDDLNAKVYFYVNGSPKSVTLT